MYLPDFFTYFFLASVFSFFGSMPPASGNLITIQLSLTKGLRVALLFALGEVLVEALYGIIALKISDWITHKTGLDFYLRIIIIPIFIGLSIFYFLNKKGAEKETSLKNKTSFLYGILIGFLNPLAIPYWIFYFSYFYSNKWIKQESPYVWALIAGIPVGSFLLLLLYSLAGKKISSVIQFKIELLNRSIAFVFLLIAVIQIILLLIG
jgi:threonine/homoserine/homoserine lactone efflux protein